jgi:hypothetical protein
MPLYFFFLAPRGHHGQSDPGQVPGQIFGQADEIGEACVFESFQVGRRGFDIGHELVHQSGEEEGFALPWRFRTHPPAVQQKFRNPKGILSGSQVFGDHVDNVFGIEHVRIPSSWRPRIVSVPK